MRKFLAALLCCVALGAQAQSVRQSGSVTPGHPAMWTTSGVLQDGGGPSAGALTGLGVTASGPSICANSGPQTGAYNRICLGATPTGGGAISVTNVGGATGGFTLSLNGTAQGIVTINLPTVLNGNVCFADTTGTLKDCAGGGAFITGPGVTTQNAAVRWNSVVGTVVANSAVIIDNSGNITAPMLIGGTAVGSTLTLESTSGVGSSDSIIFKTGSQVTRWTIDTNGVLTGATGRTISFAGSSSGTTILQAAAAASGTLTLPAATDTLIGKATTDILTNKTYDTAGTGNSFSINGLAATANTGTGAVARAAGPTFTTPALGVATATSLNGLTITSSTGTLTITNLKTLAATASLTLAGTDGTTITFQGTDTYVGRATTDTLTNKTINAAIIANTTTFSAGQNGVTGGALVLNGSTSGSGTIRVAAAAGSSIIFQIPITNGTVGQLLTTDGSGNTSWSTASGTGTVTSITPGGGLTSTLTATAPGSAITAAGTLYGAELTNAQSGTTYAIVDGDRAKLILGSNAAAQAYSIAQAGAASAFQAGWYTDISNTGTDPLGIITVTPTTSTIDGGLTTTFGPGQSGRIVSDGTNYRTALRSGVRAVKIQVITVTGTYTPSVGTLYAQIECWGAGGGGGGTANANSGIGTGGAGGGAGSYSRKISTAAAIGANQAVTIGTAGAGGSAGGAGAAGTDTSVGALCVGKGGAGGALGAATASIALGGAGGVAGTGDVTSTGQPGQSQASASGIAGQGGFGGSASMGGGGAGTITITAANGSAGSGHGSGGGAGGSFNGGGTSTGGAGTAGYVVITEYTSVP